MIMYLPKKQGHFLQDMSSWLLGLMKENWEPLSRLPLHVGVGWFMGLVSLRVSLELLLCGGGKMML